MCEVIELRPGIMQEQPTADQFEPYTDEIKAKLTRIVDVLSDEIVEADDWDKRVEAADVVTALLGDLHRWVLQRFRDIQEEPERFAPGA